MIYCNDLDGNELALRSDMDGECAHGISLLHVCKLCGDGCDDCDHLETEHADADYDFDMEAGRYKPDPRPCSVEGCDCRNWFKE